VHHQDQARTPGHIIWLGLYLIHLNVVDAQWRIGGNRLHPSGRTLKKDVATPHLHLHHWCLPRLCHQCLTCLHHLCLPCLRRRLMRRPLFCCLPCRLT
jgi:hypothetical protein